MCPAWFASVLCPLLVLSMLASSSCELQSSIPSHLLECYRSDGVRTAYSAPRRLDVFLSLLRRLEAHRSQLDMRLLSSALLRSLRLDGIEQAQNSMETSYQTPYRAVGFQFQRYKLLLDLLLPSQVLANIEEELSGTEKCLLHRLLSGTVHRWQRGDENEICPLSIEMRNVELHVDKVSGRAYSRCPIEEGVVQTEWGTIAAGTVVAAIAASLEQQTVSMTNLMSVDSFRKSLEIETFDEVISVPRIASADINNVYVATLAGDLAEVAVNQGPRVGAVPQNISIGSNNRWNDTQLPRIYYIFPQNESIIQWHYTDSEILGGIDGLILSHEINKWTSQLASLRLSQVLEMYYSNEGVSFNSNMKACNRQTNFNQIFNKAKLLSEMSNFAQMLSLSQGTVYVPTEEVDRICQSVMTAFVAYLNDVLARNHRDCTTDDADVPVMDLIVTTDGAWKKYQTEQFISSVGSSAEISSSRSTLGFLHGNRGVWISPPAHNLTDIFDDIDSFLEEWPNRLNFANVLTFLNTYLKDDRLKEDESGVSVSSPTVVLVSSPSDRLTTEDLETSQDLMRYLRHNHFDLHFIFLAQDLKGFYDLIVESDEYADIFLEVETTSVTEASQKVKETLRNSDIPKRIIGNLCEVNGTQNAQVPYEDFVSVNQKLSYRIHPQYLHDQQLVTVTFRVALGGVMRVCSARVGDRSEEHCLQLGEREDTTFNLTQPCARAQQCDPVYFTVTGMSTLNTCANMDCRFPSQIAFSIKHAGLRCLSLQNYGVTLKFDYFVIIFSALLVLVHVCM